MENENAKFSRGMLGCSMEFRYVRTFRYVSLYIVSNLQTCKSPGRPSKEVRDLETNDSLPRGIYSMETIGMPLKQ